MPKSDLIPTIGMEIHVQLKTQSKMFCSCPNISWKIGLDDENLEPNTAICPVCTGQPGTLPVPNKKAIDMMIKAGLALNCQIAEDTKFDRKNYFYPDLPKGYQISQYDKPICFDGYLDVGSEHIGITRIHLEEDTAKSIHPAGEDYTLIDFNRSSVPLLEMVTEPDIHSATTAKKFCQKIQQIFRTLDISDSDMEKSQMRCEVNISLSSDPEKLGTKVEIKNLNSFKAVERSIQYEIIRQTKAIENGEEITQETRGWNEKSQSTFVQRKKESAHDYRYFPEPDIPAFEISSEHVMRIKKEIVELPDAKIKRFVDEYLFSHSDAQRIIASGMDDFVEATMSELRSWLTDSSSEELDSDELWAKHRAKISKTTASWIINKLSGIFVEKNLDLNSSKIDPENFAELIVMIYQNKINSSLAQKLLSIMAKDGGDPTNILENEGLSTMDNVTEIEPLVDGIIKEFPDQVAEFKSGKETLIKFFIGQGMRRSKGTANPQALEDLFIQKLS